MPFLFLLGAALASAPADAEPQVLDLVRPADGWPRIYVQATLPDGATGLFLIDTGADISVLSEATAERLGLAIDRSYGMLSGLSGSTPMHRAVLPTLGLGEVTVDDIEVAVGVAGVTDQVAFMEVDGLLGNNVWGQFALEVDYPADTLVLHPPGTVKLPRRRAQPMQFDGRHVFTPAVVVPEGSPDHAETLVVQVDTGASGLTLCAATGLPFEADTTEGLETLRGIGASETLPPYRFLETTRRIALDAVELGGQRVRPEGASARWVDFHDPRKATCRAGMRALLGHEFLSEHRVVFDYPEGRFALLPSKRRERSVNGHRLLLEQDRAAHGDDPTRGLQRAKYLLGIDEEDAALARLQRFVRDDEAGRPADAAEARVLLAQLHRYRGELDEAWALLDQLSAGDLVDQEQIIASVNGLLFEDRPADALALAEAATEQRPEEGDAWVAWADALLAHGRIDDAQGALLRAAEIESYPDAHLLRRARVALAAGDRYGSMAHVRRLLELYPFGGHLMWFYALLVESEGDRATFLRDLDAATARLHPYNRPFDFLVAAYHLVGDETQAERFYALGLEEHCEAMDRGPAADNCRAWYDALAGRDLDAALVAIDGALAAEGDRSDFLDTKAMVHLARGELDAARAAARQAARMSPDDVYMLWQAERIAALADGPPATPPTASREP